MITRMLEERDGDACRLLWTARFDDAPAFVDWFFRHRFSPSHSAGTFDGGALASMSLGFPMPLTARQGDVPAWMLSGVSTLPQYERRGLMHRTVRFQMREACARGVPVVFNHPVRLHQYDALGFRPVTDTLYYEGVPSTERDSRFRACTPELADMKALYDRLSDACFGCVRRSDDLFALKMQDYLTDGARILGLADGVRLLGYAAMFLTDKGAHAEEVVADGAYPQMLALIGEMGGTVTAKLPPFVEMPGVRRPQNVAALTDERDARDVQSLFGYPSSRCFCVDEY